MNIQKTIFTLIIALSTIQQQYCMQNQPQQISPATTTITVCLNTEPRVIAFANNNTIAVIEKNAYQLYNWTTKTTILKEENTQDLYDLAVSKKHQNIAILSDNTLTVHNSNTGELQWKKNVSEKESLCNTQISSITFNPHNENTVLLFDSGFDMLHLHTPNSVKTYNAPAWKTNNRISHHPHKKEVLYCLDQFSYCQDSYDIIAHHDNSLAKFFQNNSNLIGQEYSPNGESIVALSRGNNETVIAFIKAPSLCTMMQSPRTHVAIAFHPNNQFLFLLSNTGVIECWDLATQQPALEILTNIEQSIPTTERLEKFLAVSPNGKYLLSGHNNGACITPAPFALRYQPGTKQNVFTTYTLLRLYDLYISEVPHDIIFVIIKKLLKLHRYQLFV